MYNTIHIAENNQQSAHEVKARQFDFVPGIVVFALLLSVCALVFSACSGIGQRVALTYLVNIPDGGSIEGEASQSVKPGKAGSEVVAIAAADFEFSHWSDGNTDASRSDICESDCELVAVFERVAGKVIYTAGNGGSIVGETHQTVEKNTKTSAVRAVAAPGYDFVKWSDGVRNPYRAGDGIGSVGEISAEFVSCLPFASMYITTETGARPRSNKDYISATVTIKGCFDPRFDIVNVGALMRGRGNSSWDYFGLTKGAYRLKLDKKAQLLGIGSGADRDWVLMPNITDVSMLRNWVADRLGEYFENVSFAPASTFVNFYVNNKYYGVYQVYERIEVSSSRIRIDDETEELDRGYLIELDTRGEKEGEFGIDYFYIPGWRCEFVIKSEHETEEQCEFIKDYVQDMSTALFSGKRDKIEKYADIPSIIDMFIIEELCADRDVGFASFYFYKEPGGKIFFTAPWDVDLGLGNDNEFIGTTLQIVTKNAWFASLLKQEWFKEELYARMKEVDGYVDTVIDEVSEMGKILAPYADDNYERYDLLGVKLFFSPDEVWQLDTYQKHVNYLTRWMTQRWRWMMSEYRV